MHFIRRTKDNNREERWACQSKNKGVWGYAPTSKIIRNFRMEISDYGVNG